LIRTPKHELETFYGHVDGFEEGGDDMFVVLGTEVD
jgi:hypothetical protein